MQTDYQYLYLFAAVCPSKGEAEAVFVPAANTHSMNLFLKQISDSLAADKHVILILDKAGYHRSKGIEIPSNVTLIYLPPYSPELNPVENLWHYLRSHYWSNRYYKDYDELLEAAQTGWEESGLKREKVKTICAVHYVK